MDKTITVCVRVCPVNENVVESFTIVNEAQLELKSASLSGSRLKTFTFDTCFPSTTSQEQVFTGIGLPFINQSLNCSIIAYGQTGSGKTHTMFGNTEDIGLIPRILQSIHSCKVDTDQIEISFYEIYNERVTDLLKNSCGECLKVREHPVFGPFVQGLHWISLDELTWSYVCDLGRKVRATGTCKGDHSSSRSHAIVSVRRKSRDTEHIQKMHLVDLAGSERLLCNASKKQIRESAHINKSLAALRNVILNLSNGNTRRKAYIPYRDSILTWILRDALNGTRPTLLIGTISPDPNCYWETQSTLQYACRARSIIHTTRHQELHGYRNANNHSAYPKLISQLKDEITFLHIKLKNSAQSPTPLICLNCKSKECDASMQLQSQSSVQQTQTFHDFHSNNEDTDVCPAPNPPEVADSASVALLTHKLTLLQDQIISLNQQQTHFNRVMLRSTSAEPFEDLEREGPSGESSTRSSDQTQLMKLDKEEALWMQDLMREKSEEEGEEEKAHVATFTESQDKNAHRLVVSLPASELTMHSSPESFQKRRTKTEPSETNSNGPKFNFLKKKKGEEPWSYKETSRIDEAVSEDAESNENNDNLDTKEQPVLLSQSCSFITFPKKELKKRRISDAQNNISARLCPKNMPGKPSFKFLGKRQGFVTPLGQCHEDIAEELPSVSDGGRLIQSYSGPSFFHSQSCNLNKSMPEAAIRKKLRKKISSRFYPAGLSSSDRPKFAFLRKYDCLVEGESEQIVQLHNKEVKENKETALLSLVDSCPNSPTTNDHRVGLEALDTSNTTLYNSSFSPLQQSADIQMAFPSKLKGSIGEGFSMQDIIAIQQDKDKREGIIGKSRKGVRTRAEKRRKVLSEGSSTSSSRSNSCSSLSDTLPDTVQTTGATHHLPRLLFIPKTENINPLALSQSMDLMDKAKLLDDTKVEPSKDEEADDISSANTSYDAESFEASSEEELPAARRTRRDSTFLATSLEGPLQTLAEDTVPEEIEAGSGSHSSNSPHTVFLESTKLLNLEEGPYTEETKTDREPVAIQNLWLDVPGLLEKPWTELLGSLSPSTDRNNELINTEVTDDIHLYMEEDHVTTENNENLEIPNDSTWQDLDGPFHISLDDSGYLPRDQSQVIKILSSPSKEAHMVRNFDGSLLEDNLDGNPLNAVEKETRDSIEWEGFPPMQLLINDGSSAPYRYLYEPGIDSFLESISEHSETETPNEEDNEKFTFHEILEDMFNKQEVAENPVTDVVAVLKTDKSKITTDTYLLEETTTTIVRSPKSRISQYVINDIDAVCTVEPEIDNSSTISHNFSPEYLKLEPEILKDPYPFTMGVEETDAKESYNHHVDEFDFKSNTCQDAHKEEVIKLPRRNSWFDDFETSINKTNTLTEEGSEETIESIPYENKRITDINDDINVFATQASEPHDNHDFDENEDIAGSSKLTEIVSTAEDVGMDLVVTDDTSVTGYSTMIPGNPALDKLYGMLHHVEEQSETSGKTDDEVLNVSLVDGFHVVTLESKSMQDRPLIKPLVNFPPYEKPINHVYDVGNNAEEPYGEIGYDHGLEQELDAGDIDACMSHSVEDPITKLKSRYEQIYDSNGGAQSLSLDWSGNEPGDYTCNGFRTAFSMPDLVKKNENIILDSDSSINSGRRQSDGSQYDKKYSSSLDSFNRGSKAVSWTDISAGKPLEYADQFMCSSVSSSPLKPIIKKRAPQIPPRPKNYVAQSRNVLSEYRPGRTVYRDKETQTLHEFCSKSPTVVPSNIAMDNDDASSYYSLAPLGADYHDNSYNDYERVGSVSPTPSTMSMGALKRYRLRRLYEDLVTLVEERDRVKGTLSKAFVASAAAYKTGCGLSPSSKHCVQTFKQKVLNSRMELDSRILEIWTKLKDSDLTGLAYEEKSWILRVVTSDDLTLRSAQAWRLDIAHTETLYDQDKTPDTGFMLNNSSTNGVQRAVDLQRHLLELRRAMIFAHRNMASPRDSRTKVNRLLDGFYTSDYMEPYKKRDLTWEWVKTSNLDASTNENMDPRCNRMDEKINDEIEKLFIEHSLPSTRPSTFIDDQIDEEISLLRSSLRESAQSNEQFSQDFVEKEGQRLRDESRPPQQTTKIIVHLKKSDDSLTTDFIPYDPGTREFQDQLEVQSIEEDFRKIIPEKSLQLSRNLLEPLGNDHGETVFNHKDLTHGGEPSIPRGDLTRHGEPSIVQGDLIHHGEPSFHHGDLIHHGALIHYGEPSFHHGDIIHHGDLVDDSDPSIHHGAPEMDKYDNVLPRPTMSETDVIFQPTSSSDGDLWVKNKDGNSSEF